MKDIIRKILKEEINSKQSKLLEYINQDGVLMTIKLLGGLDNLKRQLKGINFLTRDIMVNTIIDVCKEKGGFLMSELGLEDIKLEEGERSLRKLGFIDKNGI